MVQDRAICTMEDQYKVAYGLSNGAIFNDIDPNPRVRVRVMVRVRVGKVRKPYPKYHIISFLQVEG